jgi:hypothetical protein
MENKTAETTIFPFMKNHHKIMENPNAAAINFDPVYNLKRHNFP